MAINEEQQLGRAKNAVLSFLEQRLSIPKIYIDADWGGQHVDVLAINRDGVGDVHAVLLFARRYFGGGGLDTICEDELIEALIRQFASISAQYKYIAAIDYGRRSSPFRLLDRLGDMAVASDGIGRIGFLLTEIPQDGEPQTRVEIKPERFRAAIGRLADEYIQRHEADWEIRA